MSKVSIDWSKIPSRQRYALQRAWRNAARSGGAEKVQARLDAALRHYAARSAACPVPQFDDSLPVHQMRQEIRQALLDHQVIIVAGETGSGKTTQLPKICLEAGRGIAGLIGHTQPRRIAARSVAARIAEELGTTLGQAVGYKVRFNDHTSSDGYIKLMTDGILLAETEHDRYLSAYDTLIIDEAHERSLNIDFLLGYLKNILKKRRDLKVIITSATIDVARMSQHFDNAPIIEVSGRSYPVSIHYHPSADDEDDLALEDAVARAVDELSALGSGDILVFLPGERAIAETAELLRNARPQDDVLPLYARLPNDQQQRIFQPQGNQRRIVLATNVAETSLTVPGIRFVIDSGLARVNRYHARSGVERLLIEKISQASANQRAGRCGRVAAGVCIRLYSEEDFLQRDAFTDPEILRSNLAAVILRMLVLRLGDMAQFPFLQAPDPRAINDGLRELMALGALDEHKKLTPLGRNMARLPLDPKIARMLLAAKTTVADVAIIAAALSLPDPRLHPLGEEKAAQAAHSAWRDKRSDFLSYLRLWQAYQQERDQGASARQMRDFCRRHYLSSMRMRQWRDLYRQIVQVATEAGLFAAAAFSPSIQMPNDAMAANIHRALLTGLIGQIGRYKKEDRCYIGRQGVRFVIHKDSALCRSHTPWIMAAEWIDTGRLIAAEVAAVEAAWIEEAAAHLVHYHYHSPRWDKKRRQVVASARVTIYGLVLNEARTVAYGAIDPSAAREIFIREALLGDNCAAGLAFYQHNRQQIAAVRDLEHKSRRHDVLVDDEVLFDFYQKNLPEQVSIRGKSRPLADFATFETWYRTTAKNTPKLLFLQQDELMRHQAEHITAERYPANWFSDGEKLSLSYRFEMGHPFDGVTLHLPLAQLNRINAAALEWLVPGMIREKIDAYLRALPRETRRLIVPLPPFITRFLSLPPNSAAPLLPQLATFIEKETQGNLKTPIDLKAWQQSAIDAHLLMNICLVNAKGKDIASGRDIHALRQRYRDASIASFQQQTQSSVRTQLSDWSVGDLRATSSKNTHAYLALCLDSDGSVALRPFDTATLAAFHHRQGVVRLMSYAFKDSVKDLQKSHPTLTDWALLLGITNNAILADFSQAVLDRALIGDAALPYNHAEFQACLKHAQGQIPLTKTELLKNLTILAHHYRNLRNNLNHHPLNAILAVRLKTWIYPGFISATPWPLWQRLPLYLQAMQKRLEDYSGKRQQDAIYQAQLDALTEPWQNACQHNLATQPTLASELQEFRYLLEELHLSLFAQTLKTAQPVSVKRLQKRWQDIDKQWF